MIGAIWRPFVIYLVLLLLFRTMGKRSLKQTTTFDLVLLLVISEAVSSALLADDRSITGAVIAVITMIAIDKFFTLARRRWPRVDRMLTYEPTLLLHEGALLEKNMRREGVSVEDILETARTSKGVVRLREIRFVVLESSGALSIIPYASAAEGAPEDHAA